MGACKALACTWLHRIRGHALRGALSVIVFAFTLSVVCIANDGTVYSPRARRCGVSLTRVDRSVRFLWCSLGVYDWNVQEFPKGTALHVVSRLPRHFVPVHYCLILLVLLIPAFGLTFAVYGRLTIASHRRCSYCGAMFDTWRSRKCPLCKRSDVGNAARIGKRRASISRHRGRAAALGVTVVLATCTSTATLGLGALSRQIRDARALADDQPFLVRAGGDSWRAFGTNAAGDLEDMVLGGLLWLPALVGGLAAYHRIRFGPSASLVPRCRRCGYQLTGLLETRCPECGEAFA